MRGCYSQPGISLPVEHGGLSTCPSAPLIRSCFTVTLDADSDGNLAGQLAVISGLSPVMCCSCLTGSSPGVGSVLRRCCQRNPSGHALPLGHGGQSLGVFRDTALLHRVREGCCAGDHACPRSPGGPAWGPVSLRERERANSHPPGWVPCPSSLAILSCGYFCPSGGIRPCLGRVPVVLTGGDGACPPCPVGKGQDAA